MKKNKKNTFFFKMSITITSLKDLSEMEENLLLEMAEKIKKTKILREKEKLEEIDKNKLKNLELINKKKQLYKDQYKDIKEIIKQIKTPFDEKIKQINLEREIALKDINEQLLICDISKQKFMEWCYTNCPHIRDNYQCTICENNFPRGN